MSEPVTCPVEYLDRIKEHIESTTEMTMISLYEVEYLQYIIRQERDEVLSKLKGMRREMMIQKHAIDMLIGSDLGDESAINMATDPKGGFK